MYVSFLPHFLLCELFSFIKISSKPFPISEPRAFSHSFSELHSTPLHDNSLLSLSPLDGLLLLIFAITIDTATDKTVFPIFLLRASTAGYIPDVTKYYFICNIGRYCRIAIQRNFASMPTTW